MRRTSTERWKVFFALAIIGEGCGRPSPVYRPNDDIRRGFSALTEDGVIAAGFTRGSSSLPGWSLVIQHRAIDDADGPPDPNNPGHNLPRLKPETLPLAQDVVCQQQAVIGWHVPNDTSKQAYLVVVPSYKGRMQLKYSASTTVSGVYIAIASKWRREEHENVVIKRVTSIAQSNKAQGHSDAPNFNGPSQGLYMDNCKIIDNAWQTVLLDYSPWDADKTFKQGSYPGRPYVTYSTDNEWFNERDIVVQTRPN